MNYYKFFLNDIYICDIDQMHEIMVKYEDGSFGMRLQLGKRAPKKNHIVNYPDFSITSSITSIKLYDIDDMLFWESEEYTKLTTLQISYFDANTGGEPRIIFEFDK